MFSLCVCVCVWTERLWHMKGLKNPEAKCDLHWNLNPWLLYHYYGAPTAWVINSPEVLELTEVVLWWIIFLSSSVQPQYMGDVNFFWTEKN